MWIGEQGPFGLASMGARWVLTEVSKRCKLQMGEVSRSNTARRAQPQINRLNYHKHPTRGRVPIG